MIFNPPIEKVMLFCPKYCKKEVNIDGTQLWPGKLCLLGQNQNSYIPKFQTIVVWNLLAPTGALYLFIFRTTLPRTKVAGRRRPLAQRD